jgi:hypothetical protein
MNIQNLLDLAKVRFDHQNSKRILKEKYLAKLTFAYNGGLWRAGPELQNVLSCCSDSAVILDLYENPIKVNTKELLEISQCHWQEQMNAWLIEYESNCQQR